jgi:hypothetical protein
MSTAEENTTKDLKPTHRSRFGRFSPSMGWKAFWSEILIVVLGVAIALGATEIVEEWNWQNKVRDGEVRLRPDMENAFNLAAEQYTTEPCVQAQLAALSQKLALSESNWTPVTVYFVNNIRYVVRIPNRTHTFQVWESLIADGTATHFSQERQRTYGAINSRLTRAQTVNDEANQLGYRLLALGQPMALSDEVRRYFQVTIEEMRANYSWSALAAGQRMNAIKQFGSEPNPDILDADLYEKSGTVKFCKEQGYPLANWRDALKPEAN